MNTEIQTLKRRTLGAIAAAIAAAGLATGGPAYAQYQDRTIRVSNGVNQDHPVGNGVTKMAQCAAEKSGGKMKMQGFWGGALGNDLNATQQLRSGTLEMVITSSSPLVGIVKELGVFDLPFLFANEREVDQVLDGKAGQYFSDKLANAGLVNLAYWENGFRNTTNSRRPITKWEDFQGVKMRVMQNNIFLDTFTNMGSNAVPMAFSEVYSALETKAIDGQENPFVTIDTSKFFEVQRYLSITKHAYTPFLVLYSKRLFDQLSPAEQTTLRECAVQGRDEQRRVSREQSDRSLSMMRTKGIQINEISPQEQQRMREKASSVYDKHGKNIGDEAIFTVVNELKRIRGGS